MSEYKPITGELRNSMTYDITTTPNGVSTASIDTVEFVNICDTIDAIHANLERENESLKAELDRARDEWDFWESTHVELPKDVDGEVWHVGDFAVGEINPMNPKAIEGMIWYGPDSGWQLETDTIIYPCPDHFRHYHAPTVEDVLREFGDWYAHTKGGCDEDGIIAEYAAKLQLAGDAE